MTTEPTEAQVEAVARKLCPIVKPWMDALDAAPSGKCECERITYEGQVCTPMCLGVCEDIARAAIEAYERVKEK